MNPSAKICPNCSKHPILKGSYCEDCARILTIGRQQKFKSACVTKMCSDSNVPYGTCTECHEVFADCQLCIRHLHPSPHNIKISKLTGQVPLKQKVLDELDKCHIVCHNCERKIYRSKRPPTKLKAKALDFLGGECGRCKTGEPASALEFHHTDASAKTLQLGDRGLKNWDTILPDLRVCEIICANCHSLHHAEEKKAEREKFLKEADTPEPEKPETAQQYLTE